MHINWVQFIWALSTVQRSQSYWTIGLIFKECSLRFFLCTRWRLQQELLSRKNWRSVPLRRLEIRWGNLTGRCTTLHYFCATCASLASLAYVERADHVVVRESRLALIYYWVISSICESGSVKHFWVQDYARWRCKDSAQHAALALILPLIWLYWVIWAALFVLSIFIAFIEATATALA